MMEFPSFLRIGILSNMGIFLMNRTRDRIHVYGGLEFKFLQLLSEGLRFDYELRVPDEMEWGKTLENGTWTGLISMLLKDEIDIAVSKIDQSFERSQAVPFSFPYDIEELTFAYKAPGYLSKETAIFRPFTPEVWLCLLLASFVFTVLLKYIQRNTKYGLVDIATFAFSCYLRQVVGIKSSGVREKMLICKWLLCSMLISFSYTAVLLSFLTVPIMEPAIKDKQELYRAVRSGTHKCFTFKGSSLLKTLISSKDEVVRGIAQEIEQNDWHILPNKNTLSEYLRKEKTIVIAPRNDFRQITFQDTIKVADDSFNLMLWSIAVNKNFCCLKQLDSFLHKIVSFGLHKKYVNDFIFHQQLESLFMDTVDETNTLGFNDVSSAFIFLISGYILSIIVLGIETLHHKRVAGIENVIL